MYYSATDKLPRRYAGRAKGLKRNKSCSVTHAALKKYIWDFLKLELSFIPPIELP